MKNYSLNFFRREWISSFLLLKKIGEVRTIDLVKIIICTISLTILEGLGVTLILPLLDFVKSEGLIEISSSNNKITNYIIFLIDYVGLPVKFYILSIMIGLIIISRQYIGLIQVLITSRVKTNCELNIRNKIYDSTFQSSPNAIENLGNGSYVELSVSQSNTASLFINYIIQYATSLILCIAYAMIALIISPKVAIITMLIGIIVIFFSFKIIKKIKTITKANVQEMKKFSKHISESYLSWKIIKIYNTYRYESNKNLIFLKNIRSQEYLVSKQFALSKLFITLTVIISLLIILNFAILYIDIQTNVLFLLSIMCLRLIPNVLTIVAYQARINSASISVNRIFDVISSLNKEKEKDIGVKIFPAKGDIVFQDLSFKYIGSDKYVLKEFNAIIKRNKVTTVLGPSGVGKTTLIEIMMRLLSGYKGNILIDDIDINDIKLDEFRNNISLLPQSSIIFDDTVTANIKYGQNNISDSEIAIAAKLANADGFINKLPQKYDTVLGERGNSLSGGQIQRIALARLLISKGNILILDEPTSSLDNEAAKQILAALNNIKQTNKYTIIIISHSKDVIAIGDKTIKLI